MQEISQILAKMVTNMDQGSKWTCQGHLHPQAIAARCHLGTARPHQVPSWHFAMSPIRGSSSRTNWKCWSKSVQSMVMMKRPWIHGHIVIDLELHQPTYRPSFSTRCLHYRLGGATSALRCKGGASKGQPPPDAPLWPLTSLLPTNIPPLTIHYK
jgi:hypothetical protein